MELNVIRSADPAVAAAIDAELERQRQREAEEAAA